MNKANLTALLKAVKAMIMRERVAYKDYLGEETATRLLISGTLPNGEGLLTLEDATFTGFVVGETYQVTIDGQTTDCVAALYGGDIIVSVGDINSGNAAIVGFVSGNAVGGSAGEYVGKSITVSQTKTTKRYRTKKLPTELLPDGLAKSADVSKVAAAARNAQTTAEAAQTTAEAAQTTAEAAQTTAEAVEDAVSPHSRAYYAALFSKKDEYVGWWGTLTVLRVDTTTGFVYKDAWSATNPLGYDVVPQDFVVPNIYIKNKETFAVLGKTTFGADREWAISGVGISSNGKIYVIETNKIPTSQSTGFVFTFTERDDTILSTPQTLTEEQKQQARSNIGLTPVAKNDAMTQRVGLDVDGGLYTEPGAWYVTVTQTSSDSVMATADKTAAEVYAAYQAGYVVYARVRLANVRVGFYVLPLDACIPNGNGGVATLGFSVAGQHSSAEPPKVIGVLFRNNQWVIMSTDLAGLKDIPTALPNPNALTIKVGDTTTTYDGSADKTVDIPDSTIIQSSTSGSTKKFRITVDDSGTLSAVEVTDAS